MEQVPWLQTPAEVFDFPGVTQETDATHRADFEGLLARYEHDATADYPCSLPGRHRHGRGVIVRVRCGLILRMGIDCASEEIDGFKAVRKHMQALDSHRYAAAAIEKLRPDLTRRLDEVQRKHREVSDLRTAIRRNVPELAAEMVRRTHMDSRTTAPYEVGEQHLDGLAFWRVLPDVAVIAVRFKEHCAAIDVAKAGPPRLRVMERLSRKLGDVEQEVRRVESWFDEALVFTIPRNLRTALRAARVTRVVVNDDETMTVPLAAGGTLRIGLGVNDYKKATG